MENKEKLEQKQKIVVDFPKTIVCGSCLNNMYLVRKSANKLYYSCPVCNSLHITPYDDHSKMKKKAIKKFIKEFKKRIRKSKKELK